MLQKRFIVLIFFVFILIKVFSLDSFIRINQLGYTPNSLKRAIFISESEVSLNSFSIHDALTNQKLTELSSVKKLVPFEQFKSIFQLDFTQFTHSGAYYIKTSTVFSPVIFIDNQIYNGVADYLLQFMRQQRCGFNPILKDYCHQHEAVAVPQPAPVLSIPEIKSTSNKKSKPAELPQKQELLTYDFTGGWHNAADYVKYSSTTAVSVFQLLYAYRSNPAIFFDNCDANGLPYPNKIPDVLDEARWGLDWLLKMNAKSDELYAQVGDDRGEAVNWMPSGDNTDYGLGDEGVQPVYLATAKPAGMFKYQNKSTGVASLAGKFASAFALGADIFASTDKAFADTLQKRALHLYNWGKSKTGVSQTIPALKNDFQKEDNWADDMQLASAQLYQLSFEPSFRAESATFGRMEPIAPWLFADSVSHYQWFPYTNFGHFMLANSENPQFKNEFIQNIRFGLQRAQLRSTTKPFGIGVPMMRQSNSYVVSLATQCNLYRRYTGDSTFVGMETALVDWLFGCNPWGVSMVVGMPAGARQVQNPYSPLWKLKGLKPLGGLVAGPVSASVYASMSTLPLSDADPLRRFQTKWAVFADEQDTRISTESNIDGTTALVYLLANKQLECVSKPNQNSLKNGSIIQTDNSKKQISFIFSGNDLTDGLKKTQKALADNKVKASFFLTGNFLQKNKSFVKKMIKEGHYLGLHSDGYPQYARFENVNDLMVTKQLFMDDLKRNFEALAKFGVAKSDACFFLPPNEQTNDSIELWSKLAGVKLVMSTPGVFSNADISVPEMRDKYFSSDEIMKKIMEKERVETLNGNILLFHLGASNMRSDKFYNRLSKLIEAIKEKGYEFTTIPEAAGVIAVQSKAKRK